MKFIFVSDVTEVFKVAFTDTKRVSGKPSQGGVGRNLRSASRARRPTRPVRPLAGVQAEGGAVRPIARRS
jgi:hypothetical protein